MWIEKLFDDQPLTIMFTFGLFCCGLLLLYVARQAHFDEVSRDEESARLGQAAPSTPIRVLREARQIGFHFGSAASFVAMYTPAGIVGMLWAVIMLLFINAIFLHLSKAPPRLDAERNSIASRSNYPNLYRMSPVKQDADRHRFG